MSDMAAPDAPRVEVAGDPLDAGVHRARRELVGARKAKKLRRILASKTIQKRDDCARADTQPFARAADHAVVSTRRALGLPLLTRKGVHLGEFTPVSRQRGSTGRE